MSEPGTPRGRLARDAAVAALLAFLPFAPGLLQGGCFYFRDLSLYFFPLRRFAVEGLLRGELRYWNPYVHEGLPVSLPPISYPPDVLQLLWPDERGFSFLLALHVPLAAAAFVALARGLGAGSLGAVGGAVVYALGGFSLSSLSLYVHLQALAWAPLLVAALARCSLERPAALAASAAALAMTLSTTSVELAAQAILFGILVGEPLFGRKRAAGLLLGLGLGACLAAPTLLWMGGLVEGSARAQGFPVEVTVAHSIHPISLVQSVVGGLFGDLSRLADRWWGQNFFPRGFPYFLSLYLGIVPLALAALGAVGGGRVSRRIALLSVLALVACLGRWAGLTVLAQSVSFLRTFRYPSKAYFTVHLGVALLLALGLRDLRAGSRRRWKGTAILLLGAGIPLALSPLLPTLASRTFRWLALGFFPPGTPWPERLENARYILGDASLAGLVAMAAGLLAGLAGLGRLRPRLAGAALVALLGADLLRNGAGLNPMVSLGFYRLSPEMKAVATSLKAEGGRTFSFDPSESQAYERARAGKPGAHSLWSFATLAETLTPLTNVSEGVLTAYSPDLTMLVPTERTLPAEMSRAASFPAIRERLRSAGVAHVLSLDPVDGPGLRQRTVAVPGRVSPLAVRVYDLEDPVPLRFVEAGRVLSLVETPTRIEAQVVADRPTAFVVLDSWSRGWTARINGAPTPLRVAAGRHRAVALPAGESRVLLQYHPPGVAVAALVSAGAALALLLLAARRGLSRGPAREAPSR